MLFNERIYNKFINKKIRYINNGYFFLPIEAIEESKGIHNNCLIDTLASLNHFDCIVFLFRKVIIPRKLISRKNIEVYDTWCNDGRTISRDLTSMATKSNNIDIVKYLYYNGVVFHENSLEYVIKNKNMKLYHWFFTKFPDHHKYYLKHLLKVALTTKDINVVKCVKKHNKVQPSDDLMIIAILNGFGIDVL
jgi:hypothetical protein